jgi:hypothetical protein
MKVFNDEYYAARRIYVSNTRKKYGFFNFVFDCILTMITGGLWLIWVFVREMRKR